MKLLQLNQLDKESVECLVDSFENLPETDHEDGKYRLRRFSRVEIRSTFWNAKREVELEIKPNEEFIQSEELNPHQGGKIRIFEDLEENVVQSTGFKDICLQFKESNNLIDGQIAEIHQMRIQTLDRSDLLTKNGPWVVTPVSPEGIHRDGYDYICMVGINRYNIEGGNLLVFSPENRENPIVSKPLSAGDLFMLADKKLLHDATPIRAIKRREKGYLDAFVLCANK
tara:strand:+ start:575 stop:1255 length:681 start_codon:yes stop_codon:yes gene_type:complete